MARAWSATSLAAYDCPYRWWLKYRKKLQVPKPPIVALGSCLHQFLAWAHNSAPDGRPFFFKTAQSMGGAWFAHWANYCQKQGTDIAWKKGRRKEQKEQQGSLGGFGYKMVTAYCDYITHPPYPMRIAGIEKSVSATWHGFRLTGTVDQFWHVQPCSKFPGEDYPNGALVIVDLTIGNSYKGTQLALYKVATENLLKDSRFRRGLGLSREITWVAGVAVLSLSGLVNPKRRDKALTFYPTHPAILLRTLLETLRSVRDGVARNDFGPKPSPNHCTYCFYRQVCPYARPEGYGGEASGEQLILSAGDQLPPSPPKQGHFPGWLRGEKVTGKKRKKKKKVQKK